MRWSERLIWGISTVLRVNEIHTYYEESHILQGVSLEVKGNSVITLLGRNGAGKTTTLKSIIGLIHPERGSIYFGEEEITGLKPFEIARKGLGYVPENREIFSTLTVFENLKIAMCRKGRWTVERIFEILPILEQRKTHRGKLLSGGEQQMLSIARALIGNPSLLLLDEPSEGLAPLIIKAITELIRRIREEGIVILLVEQSLEVARKVSDYSYIMDEGKIIYSGLIEEILRDESLMKRYLLV
jgi:branched-chain amino acid transport system ATP-binding protein